MTLVVVPLEARARTGSVVLRCDILRGIVRDGSLADVGSFSSYLRTVAAGTNVNVTLIFSLDRYAAVVEAYRRGLGFGFFTELSPPTDALFVFDVELRGGSFLVFFDEFELAGGFVRFAYGPVPDVQR